LVIIISRKCMTKKDYNERNRYSDGAYGGGREAIVDF